MTACEKVLLSRDLGKSGSLPLLVVNMVPDSISLIGQLVLLQLVNVWLPLFITDNCHELHPVHTSELHTF